MERQSPRFDETMRMFDAFNREDHEKEIIEGGEMARAVCYAHRMTIKLLAYEPTASEFLQLAARSQHIGRWEIPRKQYPQGRKGYLQWRSQLKMHHARIASEIMEKNGYDEVAITEVQNLLMKKGLKQNHEMQILEDVICLVFLEYYFDDFSKEHEEEKIINILKKTIMKMSPRGVEAALHLPLSDEAKRMMEKAIA